MHAHTSSAKNEDLHSIEKKMMTEMGFYRPATNTKASSVESLLKEYRTSQASSSGE
jgi:hypothetical protein